MKMIHPPCLSSKPRLFRIVALLVLVALLVPWPAHTASAAPLGAAIPPGHSDRIFRVKLVEGTSAELSTLLPAEVSALVQKIDPLFTLPKSKLKVLRDNGNEKLKREKRAPILPDLSLWYEVKLQPGTEPNATLAAFQALAFVELAEPAPLLTELPATSDYTASQGYLKAATDGIDAAYAWTQAGGDGTGITIYDVEYGWTQTHEDLTKARNAHVLLNPGDSAVSSITDKAHGTAVLGEMIANNDSKGVTGIAWGADIGLAPSNTSVLLFNPANAILLALADGEPGDVILIENQIEVCGLSSYGPVEWESAAFHAIQTATANGLVVVEAAGNGGVDLDQSACGSLFDRNYRDSGAILVGAGRPPASGADRERENNATWGSCYGSRVDVQGWGSGIVTAGGTGDLYGSKQWLSRDYYYTNSFNGTSSASPIVAASAAVIQGIALNSKGAPLTPWQVRDLLVDTGSPQQGTTAEHIGPRPDLLRAIIGLAELPAASTLAVTAGSDNDGACDIGDCTLREAIAAANAESAQGGGRATIIDLTANATYSLDAVDNSDPTYGNNGLPVITGTITINAHGATIERSSAAAEEFRLFQVAGTGSLTLNQATLRNGSLSTGAGGALLVLGAATFTASTLSGNSAKNGGALANQGTLNLINSTLASNSASDSGGAITDSGTLRIFSSTLAGNSASTGANLNTSSSATLKNTILVKGSSGANCAGTLGTASVGNLADDSSCGSSATAKTSGEIALGSLASNGGNTQTMALGSTSAAIDTGNGAACQSSRLNGRDQRSYDRFFDGDSNGVAKCDVGAFEYGSSYLPPAPPGVDIEPPQTRAFLDPPDPNGNGWYRDAVAAKVLFQDDASKVIEVRCVLDPASPPMGYAELPETCPYAVSDAGDPFVPIAGLGDGQHTLYSAAMDAVGHEGEVVSTAFQLDATPPVVTCPAAGPFFLNSGDQAVGPAGVDASVSGLDEAASTLSGTISTATVGPKTVTFTARDLAGNSASQECTYNVIYDFDGYYPPVEPALNLAKAGSAIPVKFSLSGDQGLNIFAAGYPKASSILCDPSAPVDSVEETVTAGESSLNYDPVAGQYVYVWKTSRSWAGTCRRLELNLIDGTSHPANFLFK